MMTLTRATADKTTDGQDTKAKVYHSPESLDLESKVAKYNSVGQYLLDKMLLEFAEDTLFTDFESGRTWTGAQLHEKILNLASALVDKFGLKPGMVACISFDNCDKTQILSLALICAGATVACSYPKDPYPELLYLAKKVGPKILFCHERNRLKWGQQLSLDLNYQVLAMSVNGHQDEPTSVESLLNYDHRQSKTKIPVQIKDMRKQVALITMSSGTTGHPKAVPVTHWNCVSELLATSSLHRGMSFACHASLDYISGRIILFGAINCCYNAVILNGFQPETFSKALEKFRINLIYLGAASFYNLITYPELNQFDLSSVRMIFPMGAKIVYLDELSRFLEKNPQIRSIRQGYGASEIGGAAMNAMEPDEYLKDCENCGRLLPGMSAKIVDPESGKVLGPNQLGIVRIRGETVFPGYYDCAKSKSKQQLAKTEINRNQEADEEDEPPFVWDSSVFDHEGFYISGDLGYFNEKEELYIIGRQKELMSCRGAKKVLPQELEDLLDKHAAVFKVVVLGIPSKKSVLLHCPRAFIVPKSDYLTEPELIDRLTESRPQMATLDDELDRELKRQISQLKSTGNELSPLCGLSTKWRRQLAADIMEFANSRIGWEKQLTGGIVLLDDIPTSRETGKMDKNYLRSLTLSQIEIYGDQTGP